MAFTNLFFIFGYLPLTLIGYQFCRNQKIKNIFLLIVSWLFYAWAGLPGFLVLMITTLWIFACGRQIDLLDQAQNEKKSWFVGGSIAFLVLILFVYKYLNVWINGLFGLAPLDLGMPLGLSFYIFSAISYLADVAMKKAPVQKNFLDLALYVGFFAKLTMGPISEYRDFKDQLENRKLTSENLSQGTLLFFKGLVKKVIFADQLALMFASLQSETSVLGVWLLSLAYTFQLYFDFSGYSDMAIGMGKWFGFEIPKNFDHPYIADSVQNFWRRWHISLSTWFRDYVYIPLGGSRVEKSKLVRNILIVWLLTGIWHGANLTYILWGLYYGILLLIERFYGKKLLERLPHFARIVLIFLIANFGWVFFFSPTCGEAFRLLGCMFGIAEGFVNSKALFALSQYIGLLLASFIFATPIIDRVQERILTIWKQKGVLLMSAVYIFLFVACIGMLVSSTSQTFLYNAF